MCVLVVEDEVEMRCQATADGYAVKKLSSIYLEWQIPRGANVAIYRFDGAMIVCDKKSIFVSITEIMRNKSESISRSTMMRNNNHTNK